MEAFLTYAGVFVAVFVEGEITLIASSFASEKGLLDFRLVVLTAFLSTLISDWSCFFLGRFSGERLLQKNKWVQRQISNKKEWVSRNPMLAIFVYRYLYGIRMITLIYFGLSSIPLRFFLLFSFLSILLWTGIFSAMGYLFGEMAGNLAERYNGIVFWVIPGLFFMVLAIFGFMKAAKFMTKRNCSDPALK